MSFSSSTRASTGTGRCARTELPKPWQPQRIAIAGGVVQSVVEYMPTVHAFLTCRAVCVRWQGAADDAMGFLNGECWTAMDLNWARLTRHPLAAHFRRVDAFGDLAETDDDDERRRIMHNIRHPDEYELVVKHCAILCLRDRLTSLRWTSGDNWAAPGVLRFLGEHGAALERLDLCGCRQISDLMVFRWCTAVKEVDLAYTGVGDTGVVQLSHLTSLEKLILRGCLRITTTSALRLRRVKSA
jgi:hypothetical protein